MATSRNLPGICNDMESLTCKICFCVFEEPKLLDCGHTFCLSCLRRVVKRGTNRLKIECPFCRSTTVRRGNVESLTTNRALMSLVQDVMHLEWPCGRCNNHFIPTSLHYCNQCGISLCVNCKASHSENIHVKSKNDHTTSENVTTLSNRVTCEENRPKESHKLKGSDKFVTKLRVKASSLRQESTCLVYECKESQAIVVQSREEANILLSNLKEAIHDEYKTLVKQMAERRLFLLESVEVFRDKMAELETDMAECSMESTDLLKKINTSTDEMLRSPLNETSLHVACLNENSSKIKAVRSRKDENHKKASEMVCSIQKVHFESENDIQIGFLTMHNWNRTDIPLISETMSCTTLRVDGKIAVGYFDGGVELINASGSKRTILKGVQVLAIACLKHGDLVLRDRNNDISIYDTKFKKSQAKFVTRGKLEGGEGDMAVNTRDDIFVSYKLVKQIYVYSQKGGEAFRIIDCGELIPQQISVTPDSAVLVMDGSFVKIIDENGKCKSETKRDGYFGYPSVSYEGFSFIAWVHKDRRNVLVVQCTDQLQLSTLVLTDYSLPPTGRNWYQLQLLSSDEIALVAPGTIYLYRRQKTTIGEKSSTYSS